MPFTATQTRSQYTAIAWLRWRIFVNAFRRKGGAGEIVARILVWPIFAGFAFGPSVAAAFISYYFAANGHLDRIAWILWANFILCQLLNIQLGQPGTTFDPTQLIRFPLSLSSYTAIRLFFGLLSPANIIGALIAFATAVGVTIAIPGLWLAALIACFVFAATNALFSRMVFAWVDRWLSTRRAREIFTAVIFAASLGFQYLNFTYNPAYNRHKTIADPTAKLSAAGTFYHRAEPFLNVFPPHLTASSLISANTGHILAYLGYTLACALFALAFLAVFTLRMKTEFRGESISDTANAVGRSTKKAVPKPQQNAVILSEGTRSFMQAPQPKAGSPKSDLGSTAYKESYKDPEAAEAADAANAVLNPQQNAVILSEGTRGFMRAPQPKDPDSADAVLNPQQNSVILSEGTRGFMRAPQPKDPETLSTTHNPVDLSNPAAPTATPSLLPPVLIPLLEKEFLFLRRNTGLFYSVIAPIVFVFLFAGRLASRSSGATWIFPAAIAYTLLGITSLAYNSFGLEAAGSQFYFLAPVRFRDIFLAKNLLNFALALIEIIVIYAIITYSAGAPGIQTIASSLLWAAATILVSTAIGNRRSLSAPKLINLSKASRQQASGLSALISTGVFLLSSAVAGGLLLVSTFLHYEWVLIPLFATLFAAALWFYLMSLNKLDQFALDHREELFEALCKKA